MKFLLMLAIFGSLLTMPLQVSACSQQGCIGDGIELSQKFSVDIKHGGKPLAGVAVEVRENEQGRADIVFSGLTSFNGKARIGNLPPGNYFLRTAYLGISAGSECFHISSNATPKARGSVKYEWGDLASGYRQMAGRFVDFQPGQGGTPLMNQLRPIEVPIGRARMKLQSPATHAVYSTESDAEGYFSFDNVPAGTYVLHIDPGTVSPGRDYGPADLLVSVGASARFDTMLIAKRDATGGSCGGIGLELQN